MKGILVAITQELVKYCRNRHYVARTKFKSYNCRVKQEYINHEIPVNDKLSGYKNGKKMNHV